MARATIVRGDEAAEGLVGEGARPGGEDSFHGFRPTKSKAPEDEPRHQAAAVHAVLADNVEVRGSGILTLEVLHHLVDKRTDRRQGGRNRIEVGKDAREPACRALAVGGGHVTRAINHPGGSNSVEVDQLAVDGVGAAHPDSGRRELSRGRQERGAGEGMGRSGCRERF